MKIYALILVIVLSQQSQLQPKRFVTTNIPNTHCIRVWEGYEFGRGGWKIAERERERERDCRRVCCFRENRYNLLFFWGKTWKIGTRRRCLMVSSSWFQVYGPWHMKEHCPWLLQYFILHEAYFIILHVLSYVVQLLSYTTLWFLNWDNKVILSYLILSC